MKLGILFGSSSNEHEVSIISTCSIIKNLDKEKYDITPIYLDKENNFYKWNIDINTIEIPKIGYIPKEIERIDNPIKYLKTFDKIFIMVHGKNGEDGVISSIFDFFNIPYIGHKTLESVITMDKILTKITLENNDIKTSPYLYFTKYNNKYLINNKELDYNELTCYLDKTIKYPVFIKPSNSGSSIGISKVKGKDGLNTALIEALKIDNRILIEEEVKGREIECAVLENKEDVVASLPGEVLASDSFYSFDAKYTNPESKTIIPADINDDISNKIRESAIKIFKTLGCHTYSRVDFFLTKNNEIVLNEINTIPGFTEISMYPKLMETIGITYSDLLDIIINN